MQASALPLGHVAICKKGRPQKPAFTDNGADNGVRTRDPHLGKVVLYQLSHVRMVGDTRFELVTSSVSGKRSPPELIARFREFHNARCDKKIYYQKPYSCQRLFKKSLN